MRLTMFRRTFSKLTYTQGQYSVKNSKIREYFYYIDHNGMLYLDDSRMKNFTSAFKDPVFLTFFFRNLKENKFDYADFFPFISLCGIERNYIRCDDLPIVFTKLDETTSELYYGFSDKLCVKFKPNKLYFGTNGRAYHPTFMEPPRIPVGLLRSTLIDQLYDKLIYKERKAVGIIWNGERILFSTK